MMVLGSPAHIADITHRLRLPNRADVPPRSVVIELLNVAAASQRVAARHAADAMRARDAALAVLEGRTELPEPVPAMETLADAARRRLMSR
jgi:hypothetical protein